MNYIKKKIKKYDSIQISESLIDDGGGAYYRRLLQLRCKSLLSSFPSNVKRNRIAPMTHVWWEESYR